MSAEYQRTQELEMKDAYAQKRQPNCVLNHVKCSFDDTAYNPIADYFQPAKR